MTHESGVNGVMVGVPGTLWGQSLHAGGPGGVLRGVEGSRASIWGSQRGASEGPRSLIALETLRLGVLGKDP